MRLISQNGRPVSCIEVASVLSSLVLCKPRRGLTFSQFYPVWLSRHFAPMGRELNGRSRTGERLKTGNELFGKDFEFGRRKRRKEDRHRGTPIQSGQASPVPFCLMQLCYGQGEAFAGGVDAFQEVAHVGDGFGVEVVGQGFQRGGVGLGEGWGVSRRGLAPSPVPVPFGGCGLLGGSGLLGGFLDQGGGCLGFRLCGGRRGDVAWM